MNILPLIILLVVAVPDSNGVLLDNQTNYSNGIIVNQSLSNDIQDNYSNGIIVTKKSELFDSELIVLSTPVSTPISTATIISTPIVTSIPRSSGGSSGGSSSGGSGGGITSLEDLKNIIQFETHENTLLVNQPVSYKFKLPIYEVLITGKENEYDVSVRVEILKNKPLKAQTTPDGVEVIQYFNVITSTKRLKEAVIRFKTNQSAELLKWEGTKWVKLGAVENVEDIGLKIPQDCLEEQQICYTYKTNSFSGFAIVKNMAATSSPIQTPELFIETVYATTKATSSAPAVPTSPGFGVWLALIAIIGLFSWYRKHDIP